MPYNVATLRRWPEKASYYLDFVLYPAIALGVAAFTCRSIGWLALAAAGFLIFTLAEYWTHRVVLHRWFYHETHQQHHVRPRDFVVFPVIWIPTAFWVLFVFFPVPLICGFALGWWWFCLAHHAMHHWNTPLARAISRWHDLHHRFTRCNFGITHPLWDVVFGTYRSAR